MSHADEHWFTELDGNEQVKEKKKPAHFLTDPYIKARVRIPAHVLHVAEVTGQADVVLRQPDALLFPAVTTASPIVVVVVVVQGQL